MRAETAWAVARRLSAERGGDFRFWLKKMSQNGVKAKAAKAARVRAAAARKAAYEQGVRADVVGDLERRGLW